MRYNTFLRRSVTILCAVYVVLFSFTVIRMYPAFPFAVGISPSIRFNLLKFVAVTSLVLAASLILCRYIQMPRTISKKSTIFIVVTAFLPSLTYLIYFCGGKINTVCYHLTLPVLTMLFLSTFHTVNDLLPQKQTVTTSPRKKITLKTVLLIILLLLAGIICFAACISAGISYAAVIFLPFLLLALAAVFYAISDCRRERIFALLLLVVNALIPQCIPYLPAVCTALLLSILEIFLILLQFLGIFKYRSKD